MFSCIRVYHLCGGIKKMNYTDWFCLYMTTYKKKLKPRTCEEYRRQHRTYVAPIIGEKPLEAITPEDCQEVINAAAENGDRISQAVYALLHACFARAVRSRRLQWSPMEAIDRPKHRAKMGETLTDEDYKAALPFIRQDLALSLALFAGLRRGEIAGLQWRDIDLAAGSIRIQRIRHRVNGQLITATPKSDAGARELPISPELLPVLRKNYRLAPSSFCIQTTPEAIDRRWRKIQQRDIKLRKAYRLHDLRHTYVTRAILAGTLPRVVQYLAGHSTLDLTLQVYSHITAEDAKAEVLRVASLH